MTKFAQRLGDLLFDLLFVERARQRRLVSRRAFFLRFFPAIVDDEDVERSHAREL
jgi:hypothetical protein